MRARGRWAILVCGTIAFAVALGPLPALANIGLPMVAVFLPPAWFALVPIIAIESAYGVWRFRIATGPTWAAVATANCISTLIGLPVTWVVLALGQLVLFGWLPEFSMALPLGVLTVVGAPWLGPGAEKSPWMVPLASAVLTVPFYAMSVACEYLVVRRFMPDLSRPPCGDVDGLDVAENFREDVGDGVHRDDMVGRARIAPGGTPSIAMTWDEAALVCGASDHGLTNRFSRQATPAAER